MAAAENLLALAPTLSPLLKQGQDADEMRRALPQLSLLGFRHVQLSATQPGLRPRDLDRSARRDLLASLRRHELRLNGLDCWIPASHFVDFNQQDRAIDSLKSVVELASDLGRVPVSVAWPTHVPDQSTPSWRLDLISHADRFGVALADHAVPPAPRDQGGVGIDPASLLSHSLDPVASVREHGSQLSAVRLSDLDQTGLRCPLGSTADGRLDVEAFRAALLAAEFRGVITLDARQWNDPWRGITTSQTRWAAST